MSSSVIKNFKTPNWPKFQDDWARPTIDRERNEYLNNNFKLWVSGGSEDVKILLGRQLRGLEHVAHVHGVHGHSPGPHDLLSTDDCSFGVPQSRRWGSFPFKKFNKKDQKDKEQ